jgi:hypothetical protein
MDFRRRIKHSEPPQNGPVMSDWMARQHRDRGGTLPHRQRYDEPTCPYCDADLIWVQCGIPGAASALSMVGECEVHGPVANQQRRPRHEPDVEEWTPPISCPS